MSQTGMSMRGAASNTRRELLGQASSTVSSQNSGVKKFDEYRRSVNESPMAELTATDVGGEGGIKDVILADWSLHMGRDPCRWPNRDILTAGTHGKYLQSTKDELQRKFPKHPDFKSGYQKEWFDDMKAGLIKNVERFIRSSNEDTRDTTVIPLYRKIHPGWVRKDEDMKDLISMMEELMRSDDTERYWKRLEVILQYLGTGRGEEGKYLNYDDWLIDEHLQVLSVDWVEVKTLNSYPVGFTCDADGFAFDIFDALSDVWSCQSGLYRYGLVGIDQNKQPRHSKSVLVPSMAKSSGWLGKRISKTLSDYGPQVHKKGMVSKSLRQGSITNMTISRNVTYDEKLARSGHTPADSTKYYNQSTLAVQLSSANVLSGHETTDVIRLPTLQALSDLPSVLEAERVMNELYKPCSIGLFMEGGALRPLMRYVFASALRHYNKKVRDFGRESAPIDAMIRATVRAKVANDNASAAAKLGAWSVLITDRYNRDNQGASSDTTDRDLIVATNNGVKELLRVCHGYEARLKAVEGEVAALTAKLSEFERRGIKRTASVASVGSDDGPARTSGRNTRPRQNLASTAATDTNDATDAVSNRGGSEGVGIFSAARRMVLNFGASASGNSTATNEVKCILRELVEGGYLCDGAALPDTWLTRLEGKERARYKRTMQLVELCWTPEQEQLMRKKEHTVQEKTKLDDLYIDINTAVLVKMQELEGKDPTRIPAQVKASYIRLGIRYGKYMEDQNKKRQPGMLSRIVNVMSPGRSRSNRR